MSSKELSLDNRSKRQIIKQLGKHFPYIVILILSHALIVKAIVLSNASGLMITS